MHHMHKSPEEYPEIKSIKKTPQKSLLILKGISQSTHQYLSKGSKLVAYIVVLHTQFTALCVFGLKPLDQAGFMNILHTSLAVANLLKKNFFFNEHLIGKVGVDVILLIQS